MIVFVKCFLFWFSFFVIRRKLFNFGGGCRIVILASSQCKFGGKFHVHLEIIIIDLSAKLGFSFPSIGQIGPGEGVCYFQPSGQEFMINMFC